MNSKYQKPTLQHVPNLETLEVGIAQYGNELTGTGTFDCPTSFGSHFWHFNVDQLAANPVVTVTVSPVGNENILIEIDENFGTMQSFCANDNGAGSAETISFTPSGTGLVNLDIFSKTSPSAIQYQITINSENVISQIEDATSGGCTITDNEC
jgi:hypothetical protein